MKQLESGQDKIQKIAEDIRLKTLEPAKREASHIIEEAKLEAEKIIAKAETTAAELIKSAKESIEQEKRVFQSNLVQAAKQSLEGLRQSIEKQFFSDDLQKLVEKSTVDPNLIANIVKALLKAIEEEGIESELSAVIPKTVTTESINALLGDQILKKLKEGSVVVGEFAGGAKIKLHNQHMILDMSDKPLKELLFSYCRKDFRSLLFAST